MKTANLKNMTDNFSSSIQNVGDKAQKLGKKSLAEMEKGGKEWIDYVQNHPFQSLGFLAVGYFALKGLFKS